MGRIIIKNGTIVDGTGNKPYRADVLIKNGCIEDIGNLADADDAEIIDARGLTVSPGFIDTHVHGDIMLLHERQAIGSLSQGITTVITGNCGRTMAPFEDQEALDNFLKYFSGTGGNPGGFRTSWLSFKEYMDMFDGSTAINVASTAAHGNMRMYALGFYDIPTLKGFAMEKAKRILRQTLEEGAIGFTTGLSYFPAAYGDTQELIELCKIAAEYDVPYMVHIRTVFRAERFDPVEESIRIAEASGVKLHMSHFKTSIPTAGNVDAFLSRFEKPERKNLDVSFELYPYHAGSGSIVCFLPYWTVEGGYYATMERLADASLRARIEEETLPIYHSVAQNSKLILTNLKKDRQYLGRDLDSIAAERGENITQTIRRLLVDNEMEVSFRKTQPNDPEVYETLDNDIFKLLSKPNYMVGTDSLYVGEYPHPRLFGSFPKLLRMAREKAFPLETLVNRMTSAPANRFRIPGRGRIAPGMFADLVVFDFANVKDTATWETPRNCAEGIHYVLVNGKVAIRKGKATGLFAGRAIRM